MILAHFTNIHSYNYGADDSIYMPLYSIKYKDFEYDCSKYNIEDNEITINERNKNMIILLNEKPQGLILHKYDKEGNIIEKKIINEIEYKQEEFGSVFIKYNNISNFE